MLEQTIENKITEDAKTETMADGTAENAMSVNTEDKYSMEYCLGQIERIGHQTEYLDQVIAELRQMDSDSSCGAKAVALSDIVKCRETTNQQMLRFYEKMYDDLKGPTAVDVVTQKTHLQDQLLRIMDKTLENSDFSSNEISDLFNGAFDAIRHIGD